MQNRSVQVSACKDTTTGRCRAVRWLWLLLIPVLAMSFFACDEAPIVLSNLNFVSVDGLSIYSVVYSEESATDELIDVARELRDTMEAVLGCEVALTDDHVSIGTEFSYEILVGQVNRAAAQDVYPNLQENEYTVRVVGHKILLLGRDNRATAEAVSYFMEQLLGCSGVADAKPNPGLSISQNYLHTAIHQPPETPVLKEDPTVPVSPYLPEELYLVKQPKDLTDAMTLATLQGLAAASSGEQILIDNGTIGRHLPLLCAPAPAGYGAKLYELDAQGDAWTLESLLCHYAPRLQGYILCDTDLASESAAVAISMANQLKAVVVSEKNRAMAEAAGLTCVFDATKATLTWFFESSYFAAINRKVAVEQSAQLSPRMVDYAVMSGALLIHYTGDDPYLHARMFRYLDDGAVVLGENDVMGKYRTVQTLSAVNVCYVPARQLSNLSTLSGFARTGISLAEDAPASSAEKGAPTEGKHTVMLLMTDGESLEWVCNDMTSPNVWYGSPLRGKTYVNWGIPATLGDLANSTLRMIADGKGERDAFVAQLSGLGYIFPSLWRKDALSAMAQRLSNAMQDMGVSYLHVTDTGRADPDVLAPLAASDAIEGLIYTDFAYEYLDGSVYWIDGVPVVTPSYRLWAGLHEGSPEYIAESINTASVDPTSANAYSIVMVHAWSGLDESGRFVSGGDPMAAIDRWVGMLDDDVEVVSVSEFMRRLREHVAHP